MNTLDDDLIHQLRAELDALTAKVSAVPPLAPSVVMTNVVTLTPRRDRRRVMVLAAASIALVVVAVLVAVRRDGGAVGSTDSSPDTASVVSYAAVEPVAAHPIPTSPDGWDLVEWGNVRLSLPPDLSPLNTGNGCETTQGDINLEIVCGDESIRIAGASTDATTDRVVSGLRASVLAGECTGCLTLVLPELASEVVVQLHNDAESNSIFETVGPSGQWRYGFETRPTPPIDWAMTSFEGVSIRYPSDWRVETMAAGETSPCPDAVIPNTVLLDLGSPRECDVPVLVAPTNGVRMYLASPPFVTHPGWPQQVVGSGSGDTSMVVMRVGFGADPNIGLAILSSFTSELPEPTNRYSTMVPTDQPYFSVGDSVMLGAQANLDARDIPTVAAEPAGADWALEQLRLARTQYRITHGVVIQLGTSGPVTREQYEAVLAEVSDIPRVVVLTVSGSRPWIAGNNELVRSLPATHPNVVLLDWEARSAEVADHLATDGVHLRDDISKAFYTNLILEALGLPTS